MIGIGASVGHNPQGNPIVYVDVSPWDIPNKLKASDCVGQGGGSRERHYSACKAWRHESQMSNVESLAKVLNELTEQLGGPLGVLIDMLQVVKQNPTPKR